MSAVMLLADLAETDVQSCDWGGCDEDAVVVRWAEDLGEWLSVCGAHAGPEV